MSDASLRKIRLQEELDRIVPIIRDNYGAEKIIVFGSFVQGNIGPWSDLDIVVVKQTPRRFLDRILDVANIINSSVGTDIVVYTPREFAEMSQNRLFVQEEIIKKGKVLYEKNASV